MALSSNVLTPVIEDKNKYIEIALDYYISSNNKTASYELYRTLSTNGKFIRGKQVRANALSWIAKPENQSYIDRRKTEIFNRIANEYGHNTKIYELNEPENDIFDIQKMTPEQIREKNFSELETLKNHPDTDPVTKANIIKQQTELMDAKMKNNTETGAADTLIHWYLPYDNCDKCPNNDTKRN